MSMSCADIFVILTVVYNNAIILSAFTVSTSAQHSYSSPVSTSASLPVVPSPALSSSSASHPSPSYHQSVPFSSVLHQSPYSASLLVLCSMGLDPQAPQATRKAALAAQSCTSLPVVGAISGSLVFWASKRRTSRVVVLHMKSQSVFAHCRRGRGSRGDRAWRTRAERETWRSLMRDTRHGGK